MRTNFKNETIAIVENYKTEEEVIGVYDSEHDEWLEWEEFKRRADFYYDSGFGGIEINEHLKIIGKDWWLERATYDGSEWWEFKQMPPWKRTKPAITTLCQMPFYFYTDNNIDEEEYNQYIK